MSSLLEIKGLSGGYVKGVDILKDIDMSVEQGEVVGIIGLNGSGKSTLGRAIMNLLPFRSGTICWEGSSLDGIPAHKLARMGMSMMHQGGAVFPNLSVKDNLALSWGKNPDPQYREDLSSIISILSPEGSSKWTVTADKLSGGQRLELALAMTLARKPRLAILDEPSAGLDPDAVGATYAMLAKVRELFGMTILLIEQNISRAVSFCDRCFLLEAGSIKCGFYQSDDITTIEKIMFNKR